jgi:hypothetical protein
MDEYDKRKKKAFSNLDNCVKEAAETLNEEM